MMSYGIVMILCGVVGLGFWFIGFMAGAKKGYEYAYDELQKAAEDWKKKKRIDELVGRGED